MPENKKNTLKTTASTKPLSSVLPPKNPQFSNFKKPLFNNNNFTKGNTAFRTQNRGGK